MELSASAPVTWPDRAVIDRWWRLGAVAIDRSEVDPDGMVRPIDAQPDDLRFRLLGGQHLTPGARYDLVGDALGDSEVTAEVGGTAERRTVQLTMTGPRGLLGLDGSLVDAEVNGLDGFDEVMVTSAHPYLAGTLHLSPEPDLPLDLELRLRWLHVTMQVVVVTLPEDPAQRVLVADLEISSRGAWAPATAPLLAIIGRLAQSQMQPMVDGWAKDLTEMANGDGPPPEMVAAAEQPVPAGASHREPPIDPANVAEARWAHDQARDRWERVQSQIETRGWWASRKRAWLRAYDALPPVSWPLRDAPAPAWADVVHEATARIAAARRRDRRIRIDRESRYFGTPELSPGVAASDEPLARPWRLSEGDLELRWLRSPLSTWTYLRRSGTIDEQPPEGAGAAHGSDWTPDPV